MVGRERFVVKERRGKSWCVDRVLGRVVRVPAIYESRDSEWLLKARSERYVLDEAGGWGKLKLGDRFWYHRVRFEVVGFDPECRVLPVLTMIGWK